MRNWELEKCSFCYEYVWADELLHQTYCDTCENTKFPYWNWNSKAKGTIVWFFSYPPHNRQLYSFMYEADTSSRFIGKSIKKLAGFLESSAK